jgi:hypothetical protein
MKERDEMKRDACERGVVLRHVLHEKCNMLSAAEAGERARYEERRSVTCLSGRSTYEAMSAWGKRLLKSQEAFVFLGVWGKMQNTVSLGYLFASADALNLFVMCAVGYIVYSV